MLLRKILSLTCIVTLGIVGGFGLGGADCKAADVEKPASSDMVMVDGPGMMNPNVWKHKLLDGVWVAPQGDLELKISGFDYEFGIYKLGEPDNFRWHKNRFYFAGWQNNDDKNARFDLMLSLEPSIKDEDGKVLVELLEMWHEKKSIFMKLKYPDGQEKTRELRRPETMRE